MFSLFLSSSKSNVAPPIKWKYFSVPRGVMIELACIVSKTLENNVQTVNLDNHQTEDMQGK